MAQLQAVAPELTTCGCASRPRRKCPLCPPWQRIFLACSATCLREHEGVAHAGQPAPEARQLMAAANRKRERAWALYQGHRRRITALTRSLQQGTGLCVLGAGNCDDLELGELALAFESAHVVDIDAEALAAGVCRLPPASRDRVVQHGNVDLAGHADQLLAWERGVPALTTLLPSAGAAAAAQLGAIAAGPFDVVLSSCLLTQLWVPLKRTLVLSLGEWQRVFALLSLTHLLTMAQLVRPGGSALLVTEVTTGSAAEPNLGLILMLLREHPELRGLVQDLRLIEPWTWTLDGGKATVHAVAFRRR